MDSCAHRPRGFTLIEIAVVIAIIAVVSAMGISYLSNFNRRGTFNTATGDLQVALRMAKAEAYNRGTTVDFIVDTVGGNYYVVEDVTGSAIDIVGTAFNPNALPANTNLILQRSLPSSASFAAAVPTAFASALPAPYNYLPPPTAGCSFCNSGGGTNPGFGSIAFAIGNGAVFSNSSASATNPTQGGVLTLASSGQTTVANQMIFVITGRTGGFETFESLQ